MKHIALRARSVRNNTKPYTATGLGDRIHGVTTAWAYSQAHNTPVTIHLTKSKTEGGQFGNKPESWKEILSLFPPDVITIKSHDFEPRDENDWIKYLHKNGYDNAEIYCYKDHMGRFESAVPLDISKYLKKIPLLAAEPQNIELPEKFITVQWDSNDAKRTINPDARKEVIKKYVEQGYEVVTIGGDSLDENLRWSLKHIAYALSKADLHIGVDSGFMHMAMLYVPYDRIHLYIDRHGFWSHHMLRAIDNGIILNKYYGKGRL
jgi:hypothetical protein